MTVRRIAHLSDLHLLALAKDRASPLASTKTRFLSLGRPLDATARASRALHALVAARTAGADHVVVTGDLTEVGLFEELEVVADVIAASGWPADRVTLVPGNHDRYAAPDAWARALAGPLAPYALTSAAVGSHGRVVDLGSIRLVPLDVTRPQPVTRSAGFVTRSMLEWLARRLGDASIVKAPLAIVQHHPPVFRGHVWGWIDGLDGWEHQAALLSPHERVQVLHGHVHVEADARLGARDGAVFGAAAVVEDGDTPRIRVYDVTCDGLFSHGA
jgi:3',5'-cyclic AMP phosphodiesterase CpdA